MSKNETKRIRGYFGIGVENLKTEQNLGTLWRSAYLMGASFIFTIGNRYKKQASDTINTYKKIPLYRYKDLEEFKANIPYDCRVVGIEMLDKAIEIKKYSHLETCIYLLGAEDHGLSKEAEKLCQHFIKIDYPRNLTSLNVAVTGSIIMFDRIQKYNKQNKE